MAFYDYGEVIAPNILRQAVSECRADELIARLTTRKPALMKKLVDSSDDNFINE